MQFYFHKLSGLLVVSIVLKSSHNKNVMDESYLFLVYYPLVCDPLENILHNKRQN